MALTARWLARRALRSRIGSDTKVATITGFASSSLIFAAYFGAIGFALHEMGVSLTTYLASASVIGLAVSFGSQGVVQDVITGLTVVFSDLLDVGDMVDIGGQVGIVERVHMRFTVLINFAGARVYIPNRSIANVINYQQGFIRAFLDVRLPGDRALWPRRPPRNCHGLRLCTLQVPPLAGPRWHLGTDGEINGGSGVEVDRRRLCRLDGDRLLPRGTARPGARQALATAVRAASSGGP